MLCVLPEEIRGEIKKSIKELAAARRLVRENIADKGYRELYKTRKNIVKRNTNQNALYDLLKNEENLEKFKLQFNPNRIQINGQASNLKIYQGIEASREQTEQTDGPGKIFLDTEFMLVPMGTMEFLKQTLGSFKNGMDSDSRKAKFLGKIGAKEEEKYKSIQEKTTFLIYLLESAYNRMLRFQWGNMSFIGTLERVDATYTMFAPSGNPIQAKIHIRLQHLWAADAWQEWKDAFYELYPTLVPNFGIFSADLTTYQSKNNFASQLFNVDL